MTPPTACLFDAAPGLIPPLAALFPTLLQLAPIDGLPPADSRLRTISPPLAAEAEGTRELLAAAAGVLAGDEAGRSGGRLRDLVVETLRKNDARPESTGGLLRRLLGKTESAPDPLLRARLSLLLAGQADRDEADIGAALARADARHGRVLAALRDREAKAPPEEAEEAKNLPRSEYVAAWLKLFAHCALPCPNLWHVTANPALARAIPAEYRQGEYGEPIDLPELFLSADSASFPPVLPQTLAALQTAEDEDDARDAARALARCLADETPRPGPVRLELHVLPGADFPELLAGVYGLEQKAQKKRQSALPCLFGLLRQTC